MIKKIVKIGKYPFDNPNEMNNYIDSITTITISKK